MDRFVLGVIAAIFVMAASLWIGRRLARSTGGPMDDTSSRMASDVVVVIELLADRRAKLWQADGGPAPGVDDHVTVSHHVREATETILRNSGALSKDRRGRNRPYGQAGSARIKSGCCRRRRPERQREKSRSR